MIIEDEVLKQRSAKNIVGPQQKKLINKPENALHTIFNNRLQQFQTNKTQSHLSNRQCLGENKGL